MWCTQFRVTPVFEVGRYHENPLHSPFRLMAIPTLDAMVSHVAQGCLRAQCVMRSIKNGGSKWANVFTKWPLTLLLAVSMWTR